MFVNLGKGGEGVIEPSLRPGSEERGRGPRLGLGRRRATGKGGMSLGQCSDPLPNPSGSSERDAAGEVEWSAGERLECATGVLPFSSICRSM